MKTELQKEQFNQMHNMVMDLIKSIKKIPVKYGTLGIDIGPQLSLRIYLMELKILSNEDGGYFEGAEYLRNAIKNLQDPRTELKGCLEIRAWSKALNKYIRDKSKK